MRWDADKYDACMGPQRDVGRELIELAAVQEDDSVLDIGCGTGELTAEIARRASRGEVLGIDPSEEMLEKARERLHAHRNVSLLPLTVQSLNFRERFDLVFSNSALHLIHEQKKVLDMVFASLKSGGRLAIQLPSRYFCPDYAEYVDRSIFRLGLRRRFADWQLPWYLPHEEEYASLLERCGFSSIRVSGRAYRMVFNGVNEVVDWWTSGGYLPHLQLLNEMEQDYFLYAFGMSFEKNRSDRGIEFDFRRIFAFAEKPAQVEGYESLECD